MATAITPLAVLSNPDVTGRQVIADGTIALTGTYPAHGDTLNLLQLGDALKTSQLALKVEVWEDPPAGTDPTFAQFVFCPGTTLANGVLAIAIAGTQVTGGTAYSATTPVLSTATLRVRVFAQSY